MPRRKTNKTSKRRRVKQANRRRRRNKVFRIATYQSSTKPSTYGPGSYRLNVTKLVSGQLNTQVTLNGYHDIIYQNPELGRIKSDFKYFKYRGITITFYPRNIQGENNETPCYFLVNYDGLPTENLRLQDNVKLVPAFHIKQKIYKFKIPNILAQSGTLNAWLTENELNNFAQVLFQFHAPDNTTSWYFRIDINMVCRGPTNVTEIKEIKLNELNEEEEEEEEEEKDEIKEIKEGREKEEKKNKIREGIIIKKIDKGLTIKDVRLIKDENKLSPPSTEKVKEREQLKNQKLEIIRKEMNKINKLIGQLKINDNKINLVDKNKINQSEIANQQKTNMCVNAETKNKLCELQVSEQKDKAELGDWDSCEEGRM